MTATDGSWESVSREEVSQGRGQGRGNHRRRYSGIPSLAGGQVSPMEDEGMRPWAGWGTYGGYVSDDDEGVWTVDCGLWRGVWTVEVGRGNRGSEWEREAGRMGESVVRGLGHSGLG